MTDLYSIIHGATDKADLLDRLDRAGLAIVETLSYSDAECALDDALEWEPGPGMELNTRDTVKNLENRGYIIGTRLLLGRGWMPERVLSAAAAAARKMLSLSVDQLPDVEIHVNSTNSPPRFTFARDGTRFGIDTEGNVTYLYRFDGVGVPHLIQKLTNRSDDDNISCND